jgi:trk system potassium uptake protein TrkA
LGNNPHDTSILVVGLGRFGGTLALALARLGHEVLAVDTRADKVQEFAGQLTHVVEADATSEAALRQIGATDFDAAVVAIGDDIEASVLATGALIDIGVKQVWAKAITQAHGRILERIGAHHVVYPEAEMGERVAHLLTGKMIDFIEFDDDFAIVKTRAPKESHGRTLGESALRTKYGVTIVGVKTPGGDFVYAQPSTTVQPGDLLIVAGTTEAVEKFASIT